MTGFDEGFSGEDVSAWGNSLDGIPRLGYTDGYEVGVALRS
jgi:hypothetical protein